MGFFERPDPREAECAARDAAPAVFPTLVRHSFGIACVVAIGASVYIANVVAGLHTASATSGVVAGIPVREAVSIVRDDRDVPHVTARNERDGFFAEGFVEASDRLFQMDLARRYALGELAEVLGAKALPIDIEQRYAAIDSMATRQWAHLDARDRAALQAYSEGVNAALLRQPLPPEFRLLAYHPQPWTPHDSLAIAAVATLELADSWHRVFTRDANWRRTTPATYDQLYPLSDSRYDVALDGTIIPNAATPGAGFSLALRRGESKRAPEKPAPGSNVWAAGGSRTISGRALLANDPHLDLTIPGIWYLIDVRFPGLHVAGAAIPGVPGVVLGHNDRVAWGASNAQAATCSVYRAGALHRSSWVVERIAVRFARDVLRPYYRTAREFGVPNDNDRHEMALVRWPPYVGDRTTITTFLALDRATGVRGALSTLSSYRGSPQNFVIADTSGAVAYHLAGSIPNDPAWGRYVHPASDLRLATPVLAFAALPAARPSGARVVVSANNKMYGSNYAYRLSPAFEPPYRAYRISRLLAARRTYDTGYFARMQMDTVSPVDLEIARAVVRIVRENALDLPQAELRGLAAWNGSFAPGSHAASLEYAMRTGMQERVPSIAALLDELRDASRPAAAVSDVRDTLPASTEPVRAWATAGAVPVQHPLAPMRFSFLDGPTFEGRGNDYTVHLQEPGFAQGFRAVWDVGNWDGGGIVIPSGESGEPGSVHYRDLAAAWQAGALQALPFTNDAVARAARATLILRR
jgi:penicillin G amidase